jgi:membrane-associated phospholipid phosphatase
MKPWFPEQGRAEVAAPADITPRPRFDTKTANVRAATIAVAVIAIIVSMILPAMVGMKVNWATFVRPLIALVPVTIVWVLGRCRGRLGTQAAAELVLSPLLLSLPALILTYSAMRVGFPLQDARLESWDAAIGFRALDFISWLDGHHRIASVLRLSYGTFFPQTGILTIVLLIAGRLERAYAITLAILLMAAIGAFVCMFFPAVGLYVHHGIPPGAHASAAHGLGYFSGQLQAVRTDPDFVLDLTKADGIVAFPSGHAAIAVLCAWAAFSLRWIRWPFLALNAAMIVSAIPQGAHYLVDLFSGAATAGAAIFIATRLPHHPRIAGLFPHNRPAPAPFNKETVAVA